MNTKNLFKVSTLLISLLFLIASCVKEGPMGLPGEEGKEGPVGANGNESCKICHNTTVVGPISVQYGLAKHHDDELPNEEAGSTGCAPCHESEAFKYVVANNTPTAFVLNSSTGRYTNPYAGTSSTSYGAFTCFTCHKNLHTTFALADFFPLTTVAPVPLTMWGGAKTANVTPDGGISNLCIKCHQPRPFTNSNTDRNVLDYAALANASTLTNKFYDATMANSAIKLIPGYRTHTHYGTAGAMYAGLGGVEFNGPVAYANMIHNTKASCSDCHMAPMTGAAGGHTFVAKGNFNGCNTSDCHGTGTVNADNAKYWKNPRAEIKKLLEDLAAKLVVNGISILNKNPDSESNLWASLTSGKFDGYLNIYDPINNPEGLENNKTLFQNPSPSATSWTQEMIDFNKTLPKITLTNAQFGAIINFQMCLRDFSLGIHNFDYSKALLTNSIAVLN